MSDFLNRISKLSFKKLALLAAELQARLEAADGPANEPVAVVGARPVHPVGLASLAKKSQSIETWEACKADR